MLRFEARDGAAVRAPPIVLSDEGQPFAGGEAMVTRLSASLGLSDADVEPIQFHVLFAPASVQFTPAIWMFGCPSSRSSQRRLSVLPVPGVDARLDGIAALLIPARRELTLFR